MCYSRYRRLESSSKNTWKKSEDDLVLKLIEEIGPSWKEYVQYFTSKINLNTDRTARQIKERYINFLDPQINH